MNQPELFSISDLAQQFDISTRTIRYYEEIGLLQPKRDNNQYRQYTRTDRARLKLILRGKRFGFSLDEIKEMIELFNTDRTGKAQLLKTIQYGDKKIDEINLRIKELTKLRDDLVELRNQFKEKLNNN